jgi:hypothetical protein
MTFLSNGKSRDPGKTIKSPTDAICQNNDRCKQAAHKRSIVSPMGGLGGAEIQLMHPKCLYNNRGNGVLQCGEDWAPQPIIAERLSLRVAARDEILK